MEASRCPSDGAARDMLGQTSMLKILAPIVFAIGISACVDDNVEQEPLPEDGETLTVEGAAVIDLDDVVDPRDEGPLFDDDFVMDGFEDEREFERGVDDPVRPGCDLLRRSDDDGQTVNPCRPQL